ncbi:MAG: helix-turn-helix domain-containing protein [Nevskiales bacterium]
MRKTDPRWNDERITPGSGNVFADLGFDEAEARVMAMRTELMLRIEQHLKRKGWTQSEAAQRLHITQPRVSKLKKGEWREFSLDMLLTLATRAGLRPRIEMVKAA